LKPQNMMLLFLEEIQIDARFNIISLRGWYTKDGYMLEARRWNVVYRSICFKYFVVDVIL